MVCLRYSLFVEAIELEATLEPKMYLILNQIRFAIFMHGAFLIPFLKKTHVRTPIISRGFVVLFLHLKQKQPTHWPCFWLPSVPSLSRWLSTLKIRLFLNARAICVYWCCKKNVGWLFTTLWRHWLFSVNIFKFLAWPHRRSGFDFRLGHKVSNHTASKAWFSLDHHS